MIVIFTNLHGRICYKTSVFRLIAPNTYRYKLALIEAEYQTPIPVNQRECYTFILFERGQ